MREKYTKCQERFLFVAYLSTSQHTLTFICFINLTRQWQGSLWTRGSSVRVAPVYKRQGNHGAKFRPTGHCEVSHKWHLKNNRVSLGNGPCDQIWRNFPTLANYSVFGQLLVWFY